MKSKASRWCAWALVLVGCGGDPAGDEGESGGETSGETGAVERCAQVPLPCIDAAIQDLSLQEKRSEGTVEGERDGDDWVARVDATAGGSMNAAMNAWLYLRFTADGLEKVELDDVAALTSSDWDIAAKRYGIRVNSGSSGPSCVTVAAGTGDYASIDAAPTESSFSVERYYTEDCTLVPDEHGLGDPDYRMAAWWSYEGCVKTSGAPFVLRLADGRALKLVIDAYYEEGQAACNESNTMGTGGAMMTWRWRFLP